MSIVIFWNWLISSNMSFWRGGILLHALLILTLYAMMCELYGFVWSSHTYKGLDILQRAPKIKHSVHKHASLLQVCSVYSQTLLCSEALFVETPCRSERSLMNFDFKRCVRGSTFVSGYRMFRPVGIRGLTIMYISRATLPPAVYCRGNWLIGWATPRCIQICFEWR